MNTSSALNIFRKEVQDALESYYFLCAFEKSRKCSEKVGIMNRNATFWLILSRSIQTSLVIGFYRLFDSDSESLSVDQFRNVCVENISDFSIDGLYVRNLEVFNGDIESARKYVSKKHSLTESDLNNLLRLLKPYRNSIDSVYRKIRNWHYGHLLPHRIDEVEGLFEKTSLDEIGEILLVVWSIFNAVYESYTNGVEPRFSVIEYPNRERVEDSMVNAIGAKQ